MTNEIAGLLLCIEYFSSVMRLETMHCCRDANPLNFLIWILGQVRHDVHDFKGTSCKNVKDVTIASPTNHQNQ